MAKSKSKSKSSKPKTSSSTKPATDMPLVDTSDHDAEREALLSSSRDDDRDGEEHSDDVDAGDDDDEVLPAATAKSDIQLAYLDDPDNPGARAGDREPEEEEESSPAADPRFTQPTPSIWKRAALLLLIALCFWLAYQIKRRPGVQKQKVVYANRYSKEHKFRPAASPIITETLKDGRTRIRGAAPTTSVSPPPKPTPAKRKARRKTYKPKKGVQAQGKKRRV